MNESEEYTFDIEAYSPETIPMARLAEYMQEMANLLGYPDRVHFSHLERGSVQLVARAEREAVPKIRARLDSANDSEAPDNIREIISRINGMLREDNAIGSLIYGTDNIIRFPGRETPKSNKIGPFNQHAEFDGVLVRIGGIDQTAHALIEDVEGEIRSCLVSREIAKRMAQYLFGTPIRVIGMARWERNEMGEWKLIRFRAEDFRSLDASSLRAVVRRLRAIEGNGWNKEDDSLLLLHDIRGDDDGIS